MSVTLDLPDPGRFSRRAAESYTLPSTWYTDPSVLEIEKKNIFYKTWQYGVHVSELPKPGCYSVVDLADQSVILVRGSDGVIRGFHNVCQHRAHRVAEGSGCKRLLVCPYHAWAYNLDGSFKTARFADRVQNFNAAEIALRSVQVEVFLGMVFFNLDSTAGSFTAFVPGLEAEIRSQVPRIDELVEKENVTGFSNSALDCNWKVLTENCVECYHCAPAHPAFVDLVEIEDYDIVLHDHYTSHQARGDKHKNKAYEYPNHSSGAFAFWHVWPNLTFGTFPGPPNFNVFSVLPEAVARTRSRGARLRIPGPETETERLRRNYIDDVLWPEDKRICESVQRGLTSMAYADGRYMIPEGHEGQSEVVCHHFARLNLQAMGVAVD